MATTTRSSAADLRSRMLDRMATGPHAVWTLGDFADLASRAAVDKTLQRLATAGEFHRIDRGLYDRPTTNRLTGRPFPRYIRRMTRTLNGDCRYALHDEAAA